MCEWLRRLKTIYEYLDDELNERVNDSSDSQQGRMKEDGKENKDQGWYENQ